MYIRLKEDFLDSRNEPEKIILLVVALMVIAGGIQPVMGMKQPERMRPFPCCGGKQDNTKELPKHIESQEIDFLRLSAGMYNESVFASGQKADWKYHFLSLKIKKLSDGTSRCYYTIPGEGKMRREMVFDTKEDILSSLEEIIRRYDFAKLNGHSVHHYGLPPIAEGSAYIKYASGEYISLYDSSSVPFSFEAVQEMAACIDEAGSRLGAAEFDFCRSLADSWICPDCNVPSNDADFCLACGKVKPASGVKTLHEAMAERPPFLGMNNH